MSGEILGIIFDLGGVLVRTTDTSFQNQWEHKFGISTGNLPLEIVGSDISKLAVEGKISSEEAWTRTAKVFNLTSEELARFRLDYFAGDTINPRLKRILLNLRANYKTAILSNAWSDARILFEKRYQLSKLADIIIYSAEEKIAKPDPRIYELASEKIGLELSKILFIDDFEDNILAAKSVGMSVVHFQNSVQLMEELRKFQVY